jgi:hypothetical protein
LGTIFIICVICKNGTNLVEEVVFAEDDAGMREDAVVVEMTLIECIWAAALGACRRLSGWKNLLDAAKHTDKKSDWATDIDGVLAEMATAKWLGVYYEPRNMQFKAPDVGERCQTRSTPLEEGCLIVRPNDKKLARQPFVFCVTKRWRVYLVGWCYGGECMQPTFWRKDAWWVPQSALAPMSTFPWDRQKSLFAA